MFATQFPKWKMYFGQAPAVRKTDVRRTQDDGGRVRSNTDCRDRKNQPSRFQGASSRILVRLSRLVRYLRYPGAAIMQYNLLFDDVSDLHTTSFGTIFF